MSDNQQRLIDAITQAPGPLTTAELAAHSGVRELLVPQYMERLIASDVAKKVGPNFYAPYAWKGKRRLEFSAAPESSASAAASATTVEETATMAPTKKCTRCGNEKAPSEYYGPQHGTCKRCTLDRQKELKDAKAKGTKAPTMKASKPGPKPKPRANGTAKPATPAPTPRPELAGNELVIPASGEIRCRVVGMEPLAAYAITQNDEIVVCSIEQLKALVFWAHIQINAAQP